MQMERDRTAARSLGIARHFLSRWRDAFTSSAADDLAQETTLEVLRRRHTIRQAERFEAFVRTIARRYRARALVTHLRVQMTSLDAEGDLHEQLVDEPQLPAQLRIAGRCLPVQWCLRELANALCRLDPVNSHMLLSFDEGFSMGELAERFQLTEDVVKVRLHRSRERVRCEIEDRVETSAWIAGQCAAGADDRTEMTNATNDDEENAMQTLNLIHGPSAADQRARDAVRPPRLLPLALAMAALLLGAGARAQADGRGRGDAVQTPAAEVRAALRHAAESLAQVKGLKGPARTEALDQAAQAYRAVLEAHAGDAGIGGEAWFQIGEIERRKGAIAAAETAYAKAAELDFDRYGERALTERGHMLRRLKRFDEAIEVYRRAAAVKPASARAHTARTWIGRCLQEQGDLDGAVAAHRQALDVTTEPRRVIEISNWLAKACLAKGDLDGAEAALARAEAVVPEGDSPEAESVRDAFDDMSARRALQRARDKRTDAPGQAQDVENSRREGGR